MKCVPPNNAQQPTQTADECRAQALNSLASTLAARADVYPSDAEKLFAILGPTGTGARVGGAVGGLPGALLGAGVGANVGVFISDSREAKVEAKPVRDFYKQAKKCDKLARAEDAAARRNGPSMGARLPQMFVVTRQFGTFALYPYTIRSGPTSLGDYIYEDHGANPTSPVRIRFGP